MIQSINQDIRTFFREKSIVRSALQVVFASICLAIASQIEIPLYPVPVTLQTLAVFILAMTLGSTKAFFSVVLYLIEATLGLPVLAGGASSPLWMAGPTAGYLISFPIAAFVIGKLLEAKPGGTLWIAFSIFCGQCIIFTLGVSWLSFFVGFKEGIMLGFVPFLIPGLLKLAIATSVRKAQTFFSAHA